MTEQRQNDKDEVDDINPDGADLDGTAEIERQGAAGSAQAPPASGQAPQKSGDEKAGRGKQTP